MRLQTVVSLSAVDDRVRGPGYSFASPIARVLSVLGLLLLLSGEAILGLSAEPQQPLLNELPSEPIPSPLMMLITSPSPQSLEIANLVFEQRYKFDSVLKEVVFPDGKINWDPEAGSARSTYHLWMHSLNTVSYLCNAAEMTENKKYLLKAQAVLQDWLAYAREGTNSFLWYDHSVANRMVTLIYLYQLCNKQGLLPEEEKRRLVSLLYQHATFLAEPKNYSQYNHGLMMDKSLLLASFFLRRSYPDAAKGWFDLATNRIQLAFERDFTPSMVHIENSPAYHFYVAHHFRQMAALLKHFLVEPPGGMGEKVALAEEFSRCVTMPNRRVPMVGDTGPMDSPFPSSLRSKAFADAGVVIACSPAHKPSDSTWLMFKSGYLSHTHKHADDLSFVLYAHGREVFVDGGLLNYDTKNPFANHLTSALAHNTLVVDGRSYEIRHRALNGTERPPWKMFEESGLLASQEGGEIDMMRGYNAAYAGVALERTIVVVKPDVVIIYDIAKSDARHRYTQIFRVANDLRVVRLSPTTLQLMDGQDLVKIALVQLMGPVSDVRSYYGDRETIRGWGAPRFDQLVPVEQVEFTKEGNQVEFLTIIGIGQHESEVRKLADEVISLQSQQVVIQPAKGAPLAMERRLLRKIDAAALR